MFKKPKTEFINCFYSSQNNPDQSSGALEIPLIPISPILQNKPDNQLKLNESLSNSLGNKRSSLFETFKYKKRNFIQETDDESISQSNQSVINQPPVVSIPHPLEEPQFENKQDQFNDFPFEDLLQDQIEFMDEIPLQSSIDPSSIDTHSFKTKQNHIDQPESFIESKSHQNVLTPLTPCINQPIIHLNISHTNPRSHIRSTLNISHTSPTKSINSTLNTHDTKPSPHPINSSDHQAPTPTFNISSSLYSDFTKPTRKFPGPAGILPALTESQRQGKSKQINVKRTKTIQTNTPNRDTIKESISKKTKHLDSEFKNDWSLGLPLLCTIPLIPPSYDQLVRKDKLETLIVLVKEIKQYDHGGIMTLSTSEYELIACIHSRAIDFCIGFLPGTLIELLNVSLIKPCFGYVYLNINTDTISRVLYPGSQSPISPEFSNQLSSINQHPIENEEEAIQMFMNMNPNIFDDFDDFM